MDYLEFPAFKKRLNNLATVHLCAGGVIDEKHCPLGILTATAQPFADKAADAWGIPFEGAHWFIRGYSGASWRADNGEVGGAYFSLGRAYRERFVLGGGGR